MSADERCKDGRSRRRRRKADFVRGSSRPHFEEERHCEYGRLEILRTNHIPCLHLTDRPLRRVDSPLAPMSFLLEPQLLQSVRKSLLQHDGECSFDHLVQHRLGINHSFSLMDRGEMRIVLKSVDSRLCPIVSATLHGIWRLLQQIHYRASECFRQTLPLLRGLVGKKKFHQRIDHFRAFWGAWKEISDCMWYSAHKDLPRCACELYSFDRYCCDFQDADDEETMLIATRKMMFIMLNCNEFFGMDGKIYNHCGASTGDEFITLNQSSEKFRIEIFP